MKDVFKHVGMWLAVFVASIVVFVPDERGVKALVVIFGILILLFYFFGRVESWFFERSRSAKAEIPFDPFYQFRQYEKRCDRCGYVPTRFNFLKHCPKCENDLKL